MAKARRNRLTGALRLAGLVLAGWAVVTVTAVVALRWIDPPFTAFMVENRVAALVARPKGYEFAYQWRDFDRISRYAPLAVVAAEDQNFPRHHGFDFKQIDRALADRERGRRTRGASTISQQVAKNLFLWPGQSWFRKGIEAGITVLIETAWTKERILEMYLNVAEFGPGTFGVQAASRRYFHKDASRLTPAEAALLAAVLPSPRRFHVQAPSNYVRRRQAWIEVQMASLGGPDYVRGLD
jgi:monofunctional biosynthetic peptidoglycan transglycosylase